MKAKEYQEIIKEEAIYPREIGIAYCALGCAGEAGEIADKAKKLYRDKDLLTKKVVSPEDRMALIKELGDNLWYITAMANELDVTLEEVMEINHNKMMQRRATNTLSGSGDNREVQ